LDYRFRAEKNLMVMEVVIEGLQAIDNRLMGNISTLNLANGFIKQGRVEEAKQALSYLELDEIIESVTEKKKITDN
jgi:hypothetical protein